MKHLFIVCVVVLVLSSLLILSACGSLGAGTGAGNGNIELTLVSETDQGYFGPFLKDCMHFYSISGPITIEMTPFAHDSETILELPRSNDPYVISFYWQSLWKSGEKNELYSMSFSFTARRSFTINFTCDLGHGVSPQPVPADWTLVE
jgi:hypothetical protein